MSALGALTAVVVAAALFLFPYVIYPFVVRLFRPRSLAALTVAGRESGLAPGDRPLEAAQKGASVAAVAPGENAGLPPAGGPSPSSTPAWAGVAQTDDVRAATTHAGAPPPTEGLAALAIRDAGGSGSRAAGDDLWGAHHILPPGRSRAGSRPPSEPPHALNGFGSSQNAAAPDLPMLSILIPAHNEARHIRQKLSNTLALDYPRALLEVVVCSDGSTDGTDELVNEFAERGVRLVRNNPQQGKPAALATLMAASTAPLVLFTDASAKLDPKCVRLLVDQLADPLVGVAAARYSVRPSGPDDGSAPETERAYWDFEARLRAAEAERDMLLGASGAAYAIRRELVRPLPHDTVNDDYVIPLLARMAGYRVAYVHDAVASDDATETGQTLYRRWVRIAYGNWQMVRRQPEALSFREPRIALPFWRKVLRTAGPVLLLLGFVAAVIGGTTSNAAYLLAVAGGLGFTIAVTSVLLEGSVLDVGPVRALRYVALSQLAYLHGGVRFAAGRGKGIWRRAPENEPISLDRPAPLPLAVRAMKRAVDVLGAAVAIAVFSPIMLFLAIWIPIDSRGSPFYTQERERPGGDGRPIGFRMFKFRSMVSNAESGTGPIWATTGSTARVTRVGRIIRKYRLDELPQFFNVLIGDMSIVGPRPERPFFTRMLADEIPGYVDRISVIKPGITGWAQVNVASDTDVDSVKDKVKHDLAYLAHLYTVSTYVRMELKILWRTIFVMVSGKGAA